MRESGRCDQGIEGSNTFACALQLMPELRRLERRLRVEWQDVDYR